MHRIPVQPFGWLRARVLFVAIGAFFSLGRAALATDLSGCWEGCWQSGQTGHDGRLRATISKVDDTHYCAQFSGTFYEIVPFRYSALLSVTPEGDGLKLEGSKDLGLLLGGTFSFDGTASDTEFNANYSSRRDCGVFKMKRVPPCNRCCR